MSSSAATPAHRRRRRLRAFGALPGLLLAAGSWIPTEAVAGAWTLPEGARQVIVTGTFISGDRLFNPDGRLVPVPEYAKFELTPFAEYGVTDWLTAIASTSLLTVFADGDRQDRYAGLGYTELGARARVASFDAAVLSVQTTAHLPGQLNNDRSAEIGNSVPELDMRLLAGTSFALGGWDGFIDGQAAYRLRGGELPNEYRIDLTFGVRPVPSLLLLAQSFNVVADGPWPGVYRFSRYHKLQGSIVYDISATWSVQAGIVGTVAGRNALRERGAIFGAWARF